jgi:hypothetical protein
MGKSLGSREMAATYNSQLRKIEVMEKIRYAHDNHPGRTIDKLSFDICSEVRYAHEAALDMSSAHALGREKLQAQLNGHSVCISRS